jgi:alkylhydroperoxidase family enzyme
MANVSPVDDPTSIPELAPVAERMEAVLGFVPNSILTMDRVPGLAGAFSGLAGPILRNDLIEPGLVQMIAMAASTAAGSRYCQAHTSHTGHRVGVAEAKLADVYDVEHSDRFSDAERAALRLAFAAASVPNRSSPDHFAELREHFDDEQIAAIVAVIALFGFLNRWNDTIGTELEDPARQFGERVLAGHGWDVGKHT